MTTVTDRCVHEMVPGTCGDCTSRTSRAHQNVWTRIEPSDLFHYPDCEEVTWDPDEAENPGLRVTLTTSQVQSLLADGVLNRGCLCCEASV